MRHLDSMDMCMYVMSMKIFSDVDGGNLTHHQSRLQPVVVTEQREKRMLSKSLDIYNKIIF